MQSPHVHSREAGFTFAEIAFGMLILVLGAVVLINHISINYQTTNTERDRVFAYTKAQSLLSEIQAYVDRGQVDAAVDLDVLDDGVVNKTPLTIETDSGGALLAPDHALSGNYQRNNVWVWSRRISVQPFVGLNNRNVRYVTVRIYKKDSNGQDHSMADLSAVINSAGSAFPTTQVFDLYLLAIENIPGWWVFMDSIKPFVESMITDLETRNPGLQFRTHWITKAAFGRNQGYRPYTNDTTDSYADIPDVYHYSGRMPSGNASTYYYVPDNIRARVNVDGTERHGYSDGSSGTNPYPYALADFFNHAMRYPDELALWQNRVKAVEDREQAIAAAKASGTTPPPELDDMSKEPTFRLLLEDMCTSPAKYHNALMINLHGELLPMPALRNYSDAAKEPVGHPNERVVVHPEELRTRNKEGGATDDLALRVYAYRTNARESATPDRMSEPLIVEIMGVNLVDAANPGKIDTSVATIQKLAGGVPVSGNSNFDTNFTTPKHSTDSPVLTEEMYYTMEFVPVGPGQPEAFTRFYLYNTPLIAPIQPDNRGLPVTNRGELYWMPYVPSPVKSVSGAPDFENYNLGRQDANAAKNTARWRITVRQASLTSGRFVQANTGTTYDPPGDVLLKIRTRIGSGVMSGSDDWKSSGTLYPTPIQQDNLSVTYAWWTDSLEDVPFTERAQFNGDPRYEPYKDCFAGAVDFPNAYNWYHSQLTGTTPTAVSDFTTITAGNLANRWSNAMTADVPRYFELLRTALVKSAVVYTTLTGYSYYYLGIGNDIGYDSANGYANSIPSNMRPHGSPGTNGYINTIIGARKFVRSSASTGYWWGIPWLGELYPDDAASVAAWTSTASGGMRGNLPAGTSGGEFYQANCSGVYSGSTRTSFGTTISDFLQRTAGNGCTCFFNIGTSSSSFHHTSSSGNGTLTTVGTELATNYNMAMPSAAPITRPFGLTWSGGTGEQWSLAPYATKNNASLYRTYYTHSAGIGSGLVKLSDNANTSAAYIVVNGISNAVDNGTTFISKFAMLSLVHSFFEAGSTTNTLRIPQLPRLEIESPTDITELNNPSSIPVQYGVSWTRWDGLPYSASGTFSENEAVLEYVLMYSNDGGANWYYLQDNTPATPGERPSSTYIVNDAGAGMETYPWDVSDTGRFQEGSYILRADCYRAGASVHYSYHKTKIFIQR